MTAIGAPAAFTLAGLSGMAHAATFPPLSWSMVAWLALTPLLVACASLSPRSAANVLDGDGRRRGGVVPPGHGVPLLRPRGPFERARVGSDRRVPARVYVSTYAAWVAWLARRRAANPVLLAGGWLACEFARSASGGGWALTAYSQLRSAPLIQIADLAGPYGIGMLVAAVNAGAAALLVPALRGRRPLRSATTIAVALAGTLLYGQWRLDQTFDDGPAVEVPVVQGGAAPAQSEARAAHLERYVSLTRSRCSSSNRSESRCRGGA